MDTVRDLSKLIGCFLLSLLGVSLRGYLPGVLLEIAILFFSACSLILAADFFTSSSLGLGKKLNLNQLASGILIISLGTSSPELFSSIGAILKAEPEIVYGNVMGTVVANTLLGVGCAALFIRRYIPVHQEVAGSQLSIFLCATLLVVAGFFDGQLDIWEGLLMLATFVAYIIYVIRISAQGNTQITESEPEEAEELEKSNTFFIIGLLLVSLVILFYSGEFIISSILESAQLLNISSVKLATSILAIGTSIPEIATAISLVRKNNVDSLFGEIIGSNIFDILLIFGGITMFYPLVINFKLYLFQSIYLVGMFFLLDRILSDKKVFRIEGVVLIVIFIQFLFMLYQLDI